jgi:hypothetical protein
VNAPDDVLPEEGSIRQQRQERNVMRGFIASCISIVALYLSLAFTGMALADTAMDVKAVYAAWDAAFNKGMLKLLLPSIQMTPLSFPQAKWSSRVELMWRSSLVG